MNPSSPSIAVAPEALTLTWVVVGSLILELLVLIVFVVRVAWWLSQRFGALPAHTYGHWRHLFTAIALEYLQVHRAPRHRPRTLG